jgi:hypothetical protein
MRYLIGLIASIVLLTGCKVEESEYWTWRRTCSMLREVYQCGMLSMPKVEYEEMRPGLLGYYKGGDTIWINSSLSGKEKVSTLIHEYTHYLQVKRGNLILPGPAKQVCDAEAEAFMFTDVYRRSVDLPLNYPNWWRAYPYCWQYYAPRGSRLYVLELPSGEKLIHIIHEKRNESD